MTIEQAIEKAIRGGMELPRGTEYYTADSKMLLVINRRDFWQSLGKSEGWGDMCSQCHNGFTFKNQATEGTGKPPKGCQYDTTGCSQINAGWQYHWHRLIDHLAEGKSIEDYFKTL